MPEQHLHNADVSALLQKSGREAVAKGVRSEVVIIAAGCSRGVEGLPGYLSRKMSRALAVGEEPLFVAMDLPDLAQHGPCRLSQRKNSLFVAFADDPQEHPLGVDGGDRQGDGLADPQAAGVGQGETAAVDRLPDGGDQAAAVRIAPNVGQAFAVGLADFFLVSSGQSRPKVLTKRNLMPKK
jgi:hypothetical protein